METRINYKKSEAIDSAYHDYRREPSEEKLAFLLKATTPLIRYFASYYSGGFYDRDILQAGYEGVLKAIKNYSESYGASFTTYAGHYVIGEVRHYIRKEMKYYKPNFIRELQDKAQGFSSEYYSLNGEVPPKSHIAQKLNISESGIDEILKAGLISIDELELDKISCLKYESFKLPIEDKITLIEAIRKLSEIKQYVVYSLFFQDRTQQQTADSLGINQRKVSRLLKSSLEDLKYRITEQEI